ncbi:PfkB family carbohydrate kinase [Actinacidiphila soli]|uniref:PfkB family carbohydrate kinase n=1 Tax=Actinacidiphila soli TaxID=2487275 RepID=UPI000FC9B02A|nr:PfkB family carbohydrate kinase [Actinacidiphila soli]
MPNALFVGLCTLDVIQLVDHVPAPNEKLTALAQTIAAGGPATNAAATFSHLGGTATLLTAIGTHPLAAGITADLAALGVTVLDQTPADANPPTVSTIQITAATGERAVASTNAAHRHLTPPDDLAALVAAADFIELDGHHLDLAMPAAQAARRLARPTLLDAGSWKPGTEALLPSIDIALCSADFHPPGTALPSDTLAFLHDHAVPWAAISHGPAPILWSGPNCGGTVPVPALPVADTLAAGDILHGALTYYLAAGAGPLDPHTFPAALTQAAAIASRSCASFGTRAWLGASATSGPATPA